jgi:hypothetical protein
MLKGWLSLIESYFLASGGGMPMRDEQVWDMPWISPSASVKMIQSFYIFKNSYESSAILYLLSIFKKAEKTNPNLSDTYGLIYTKVICRYPSFVIIGNA